MFRFVVGEKKLVKESSARMEHFGKWSSRWDAVDFFIYINAFEYLYAFWIFTRVLTETIYVRVFEERMDLIRAAIVGAPETPYHDCLFFFDIFLPPEYPYEPPVIIIILNWTCLMFVIDIMAEIHYFRPKLYCLTRVTHISYRWSITSLVGFGSTRIFTSREEYVLAFWTHGPEPGPRHGTQMGPPFFKFYYLFKL